MLKKKVLKILLFIMMRGHVIYFYVTIYNNLNNSHFVN